MEMRILSLAMLILFSAATVLQYNDPDLVFWMPVYGLAALWSWLFRAGKRLPEPWVEVFAVACLVAALYLVSTIPDGTLNYRREELSESGGLLITGAWSLVLARRQRMESRGRATS